MSEDPPPRGGALLERVQAAQEYARSKGVAGLSAVSNNFSLARMIEPPWHGCLAAWDAPWRKWLTQTQLPLMPWSSQARGFFAGRADPNDRSDSELVRCWYSDDNFRRLRRTEELTKKLGMPTIAVALAYVLCQPFPTFPLIGPRTLEETASSFLALEIDLTDHQLARLEPNE